MSFADVMRRWEVLHPYNFTFDLDLPTKGFAEAARETMREIVGIDAPIEAGDDDVEHELNRPFDSPAPVRIRPHGFTFRHAFWDGVSADLFVQRTLRRARGETLDPLIIRRERPRLVLPSVRDLLRMRRVHRRKGTSRHNRVATFDGKPRLALELNATGRRRDILIATAVDLRKPGELVRGVHVGWKIDGRVRRVPSFAHLLSADYMARQYVVSAAVTAPRLNEPVIRAAVSTGPLVPLVLVIVRNRCSLIWQEGAFSREEILSVILSRNGGEGSRAT